MSNKQSGPKKAASLFVQRRQALARSLRRRIDPEDKLTRAALWRLIADTQLRREGDAATAATILSGIENERDALERDWLRRLTIKRMNEKVQRLQGKKFGSMGGRPRLDHVDGWVSLFDRLQQDKPDLSDRSAAEIVSNRAEGNGRTSGWIRKAVKKRREENGA